MSIARRKLLQRGLSLGALTLLTGCYLSDNDAVQSVLARFSTWNDRVQAALFRGQQLAPTFPESMAVKDFRYNAWYSRDKAPRLDPADYRLLLSGKIADKRPWTVAELHALPQATQITRHVCVEGWSAIGSWQGVKLSDFLKLIGADLTAKYVWFQCAEGYSNTIDMPTALHPQTQLTLKFDHQILPRAYGFPIKIRIPTKLGFKNPKYVTAMWVQNNDAGGYWENQGYNWFSGL